MRQRPVRVSALVGQSIRFGLIGVGTAAVYFGVLVGLVDVARMSTGLSAIFSCVAAIFVNYLGQKTLTFRDSSPHRRTLLRYGVVTVCLMAVNSGGMAALPTALNLPYLHVQWIILGVIALLNYALQRLWIYKKS